jgi:hypothetical protein
MRSNSMMVLKKLLQQNIIAENLIVQVDEEGNRFVLMKEITGHQKGDDSMSEEDSWIVTKSGTRCRKPTTCGWLIQVDWKDGSSSLLPLKDIKNSHPVQVVEYDVAAGIVDEPAWWARACLKRHNRIIGKVKQSNLWLRTHKFGIEILKSPEHALELDAANGNHLWRDAMLGVETTNVRPAFEKWERVNQKFQGFIKRSAVM